MTAFNTSTNTGSATFTNAYSTVELLASDSVQKASGFARTTGWRYFEWHITDQGGDSSRLFVGLGDPAQLLALDPDLLYGGASRLGVVVGSTFNPPYPYTASTFSMTACTGDVFMFAVDMSGQGRNHLGAALTATLSSGGENLTTFVAEVGKNGVWPGTQLISFAWPSHGYPMRSVPWAVRDSTSAVTAKVSLKVETTSFAYAIPAGMVAWGDGPEGGTAASATYSIAWDPLRKIGGVLVTANYFTLTDSNYLTQVSRTTFTEYVWIQSTPLPTVADALGARVIEFRYGAEVAAGNVYFNLVDQNVITNLSVTDSEQVQFFGTTVYRHGVIAASTTGGGYGSPAGVLPLQQYVVNHTTGRVWATHPGNNAANGNWLGTAGAATATPYGEVDGFTVTDSVGWRWMAACFASATLSYVEINSGKYPFMAYPLMPGLISLDGRRQVYGVGDTWKTGISSVSYTHSNLGVLKSGALIGYVESSGSKNAGKLFAQVWAPRFNFAPASSMSWVVGLRLASETKLSTSAGVATRNNIVFELGSASSKISAYSITTVSSISITAAVIVSWQSLWYSIAVDFDVGKIWLGMVDTRHRRNVWANGGDPVAGSGGLSFTAGTAMKVFSYLSSADSTQTKPLLLVAETNNVVDLPAGFVPWNGSGPETSLTATPSSSAAAPAGLRNIWPTGVIT